MPSRYVFSFLVLASLISIMVVYLKKKNNNSNSDKYYLSDKICEKDSSGKDVCYRKINIKAEHYIHELSDKVKREHVKFDNRYGITLAADLYTPKNLDKSKKYKGLVIGPPYGGVKEQGPCVYANYLAENEFVVVAFDPSFNGESGGKNKKVSSSDIFIEDFSAGVDYLGTLDYVDRDNIGGIGICGSGGFLLGAAAIDLRIKAVITIVMYDIPYANNIVENNKWQEKIKTLKEQRWNDVDKQTQEYPIFYKEDRVYVDGTIPSEYQEYDYWKTFYSTERGHHARSTGGFTYISDSSLVNLQVTNNIDKIAPRKILFIGDSKGETLSYNMISKAIEDSKNPENKRIVVENTTHIDLYDQVDKIPFNEIIEFLKENLK